MYTISFAVTCVFLLIAAAVCIYALTLHAKDDPRAKKIMTAGLVTACSGILVWAVIFGFFSV